MLRWMVFALLWPCVAMAQSGGLSDAMRDRIIEGPDKFEAYVASLILGYGSAKGIDAQGLEDYLAVERAKRRVRELRRMMLADLNDDGAVTQAELFVVMSAQGASARGTLWQAHSAADTNADGTVTQDEMQAQARTVAARPAVEEADVRGLMALDFNKDGHVSTVELRHALTLIAPKT